MDLVDWRRLFCRAFIGNSFAPSFKQAKEVGGEFERFDEGTWSRTFGRVFPRYQS
jgi:hypothetical protein